MQRMPHPASGMTPEKLNPPSARNTDSCLPLHPAGEVVHDYSTTGPAPGDIRFGWAHGSIPAAKNSDPHVQVVRYNEDTFCMRENICVDWRGPFTFLLFGNKGALLIDTGATENSAWYPLRSTVEALILQWEGIRRKTDTPLTIALTSAENAAQNGGLSQFAGRANTTVVPRALPAMQSFYGVNGKGPEATGQIDLGGRILDAVPTPGTHRDGVSFYDRYTHLLFTGDLLFPGRIAIANERDYMASLERLQQWKAAHPVKWVMGGHIDMQFLPGKAYSRFATFKPYERELQMEPEQIEEAASCAKEIAGKQTVLARSQFWMRQGVGPDEQPESLPAGMPDIRGSRPV
ncbi:MAG: MBL fold metallo-hydrolase [Janthinobacterium lividum]